MQAHGILIMNMLEMKKKLVLIIVHHLILTIAKNYYLIIDESPTFGINGKFGLPEKIYDINFTKANTKFCFCLRYNADNSYLFVNEKRNL